MARNYSNVAVATTLSGSISSSTTSITVASNTGYPAVPYSIILDAGTPSEEVCEVTAVAGTTWTVTRGVDGTPATSHASGAAVEHGVSARDWREPNEHVSATTSVHGIANTANLVTTSGTQTLSNKTLSSPIINGSISLSSPTLVTPTIASFANAQHAHVDAASGGELGGGSSGAVFLGSASATSTYAVAWVPSGNGNLVTGMSITYTAPDEWPEGASGVLYSLSMEHLWSGNSATFTFRLDGTNIANADEMLPSAEFGSTKFSSLAVVAPLPSAGDEHTFTVVARKPLDVGTVEVYRRWLWMSLV